MKSVRPGTSAYAAAASMALVTLFVFYTLQNYGPESAVRRLNALLQRAVQDSTRGSISINGTELGALMLQPRDSNNLRFVVSQFAPYFARGASFQILKRANGVDYPRGSWTEHTVLVEVAYRIQGSVPDFVVWVAARDQAGIWKIDPDLTATARGDVISRSTFGRM